MLKIKKSKLNVSNISGMILRYIILTGLAFVIIYPFLIKLEIAFMDISDLNDANVRFVPKTLTLDNIINAWKSMDYGKSLLKTSFFTLSLSFVQVAFAMITAYGLASFKFPGVSIIFASVLLTLIAPPQAIILPLYLQFQSFDVFGIFKLLTGESINLIGKSIPLYLLVATGMGLKNGLLIFIFRQFFLGLPKELEESASIDGAGVFRTFVSIIVPSAKPMLITCFLFSIVWQWTDSFYTSIFMPDNSFLARNLEKLVSMVNMTQPTADSYQISMINNAGIILYVLPPLLVYFIFQRHFVESIERTGLVG